MKVKKMHTSNPVNQQRRTLLQGAVGVGAASMAPVVFGKALSSQPEPVLSGKLVSKIYDPVHSLVLRNHTNQPMVIKQLSKSALMFDGGIVDCNTACLDKSITIPANDDVLIQFDRRKQVSATHKIEDYRRIQSRVARLNDGTRVVPFNATVAGNVATVL